MSDGASLALIVSGGTANNTGGSYLIGAGVAGYAFGPPLIHFGHHNPGRGLASFALRVPAPILVGLGSFWLLCGDGGGDFCGLLALPPAAAAILLGVILDPTVLAHDRVPENPRGEAARWRVLPTFTPVRQGAVAGLTWRL